MVERRLRLSVNILRFSWVNISREIWCDRWEGSLVKGVNGENIGKNSKYGLFGFKMDDFNVWAGFIDFVRVLL